jgi:hypothetical protein
MKNKKIIYRLSVIGVLSISFVVVLFLLSEKEVHLNNAFTRRYIPRPITKLFKLPLKYNAYYISGWDKEHFYLSSSTAPLHVLKLNLKTRDTQHIKIKLERKDLPFRSVKTKIIPPYFFVTDGTVPCVFRGNIKNWQASLWMKDKVFFTESTPIDSNTLAFKTIDSKLLRNILGVIQKDTAFHVKLNKTFLKKQIEGVFCTAGKLHYSTHLNKLIYVYLYRNQYIVTDTKLTKETYGKTIDTISKVQLKVVTNSRTNEKKLAKPPVYVNQKSFVYKNYLYVKSNRLGKFKSTTLINQASIIDVYNISKNSYEFSFYLQDDKGKKVKDFAINGNHLLSINGSTVLIYKLKPSFFPSVKISAKLKTKPNNNILASFRK